MYQAAVSKKESSTSAANVMETEACTLPGGLASVKKQFEGQEIASSHSTVTQYHYQHKSVQEVISTSEVTIQNSSTKTEQNETVLPTAKVPSIQTEKVSATCQNDHQASTTTFHEHFDETVENITTDEEMPKISTQIVKQQFERRAQENVHHTHTEVGSHAKQIKIENEYQHIEWPPVVTASTKASEDKIYEDKISRKVEVPVAATASAFISSTNFGSMEEFPPPPPDLLQIPSETVETSSSPELSVSPTKQTGSKDLYSKQRNLYELKRLYKHIHPEVRKNLEKDYFNEVTEIVCNQTETDDQIAGDVQQARYVFENTDHSPHKCMSPEREYLEWDEILKGEVQSMRWIFENQPLDSIKDESPDQKNIKSISEQEIIAGGDVKYTAWMFETQPIDSLSAHTPDSTETTAKVPELARGDVRTATWLFETQPLDSMNKIYQEEDQSTETSFIKDITGGDVKNVKYLFETQHLDKLGQLDSVEEVNFLQLKSELEEIKGDVKTTTRLFETQPLYVIRDSSGQVLEIKTVQREDIEKGDVRTARWLFETQPLDMINKDASQVKVVCGISMEENVKGGVNRARWLFETQYLDTIKEETETCVSQKETILGTDVRKQCWIFETQPLDTLKDKDNDNARPVPSEEIIGGDVQTAKHLFETVPMDALKDSTEVGKLQKLVASEEEKGDVRYQKWVFETKPLEHIREEKKEYTRTVNLEEINKGDVTNYKQVFETMDLGKCNDSQKIQVEGVTTGSVKSNKALFETTPLYALQDSCGKYHEVKTVRREEILRGDVRTCRWMFETKPIDQFDESIQKFQIIKGISKEEIQSGDVKTAKWLFETQPLDSIKYFSNVEDGERESKLATDIIKGDVKTCKWLFETQPLETLYDKVETVSSAEEIHKGDVKTCTWLFETQPLDAIRDDSEATIKMCTVKKEEIHGSNVRMARFLFETENLENIQGEDEKEFRRITEIDIQSGDVSRMKYIFENQSTDIISSSSEEMLEKLKSMHAQDIQKGNVLNCTWLFENNPIDAIKESTEENKLVRTVTDVQGGNVGKGRFIFETFSLDQIKDESSEANIVTTVNKEEIEKGDVKNYTMLFETQPLYAIQDKEGHYHEVTTVRKEEVISGDVHGTRWLFETKPLDSIKDTDEVYVIRAVTQEDIQKGDVSSARWRFETQPLDKISEDVKIIARTVDDVQGGNVKSNKELFESEESDQKKCVRTVSVSEIQHGDVRTATWLFETHTIGEIRGEGSEYKEIKTVTREDVQKGDVQQAIWLFEKQPLDTIKENDETSITQAREEIPQADVRTTTWLFETTPFHEFNESKVEKEEIIGKSIKETLNELYSNKVVESHGIIIEANEIGDVRLAKYNLMNQESPEIQKEEVLKGDIQRIMVELLSKQDPTERGIVINEEEKGNVDSTIAQLLNTSTDTNIEKEEIVRGNIKEAIENLCNESSCVKRGILIQENEKGDVKMIVYSLLNTTDHIKIQRDEVVGGDIKRIISSLLTSAQNSETSEKVKIDDSERGNVQFYTTCIESGALDYLTLLKQSSDETNSTQKEEEEIIGGDVEGTKLLLRKQQMQFERTVNDDDIVPGDVCNTVKIFMTEPQNLSINVQKEEIVRGDLKATLDSLSQAINQVPVVEKEDIVKGDLPATLKSLEDAKHQVKETEKVIVIPGNVKCAMDSLEKAINIKAEVPKDEVIHADLQSTIKSLNEAQHSLKAVEKEEVLKGDIQSAVQNLLEASSEKKALQHQISAQGDVRPTIQMLLMPTSQQTVQHRTNVEGDVQSTIKTLLADHEQPHNEKEIIAKDTQSTSRTCLEKKEQNNFEQIDVGGDVEVNFRTLLSTQQQGPDKGSMKTDKIIVSGNVEEKQKHEKSKSGSCFTRKIIETEESENYDMNKKNTALRTIQSLDTKTGVNQHFVNKKNKVSKTKEECGSISQQEVQQKMKVLVKTTPQATEIPKATIIKGTDHLQKQVTKESKKTKGTPGLQINKPNVQTHVSQSISHNVKNKQIAKPIKEEHEMLSGHRKVIQKTDAAKQNMKSGADILEKSKMTTYKVSSGGYEVKKKEFNPVKTDKKSKTEIHFPPLPPPPPSSLQFSENEFPLPPPPPSTMECDSQIFPPPSINKDKTETDSFPPPPPPVDHIKSEIELLPPPPPPPFPLVTQKKETASSTEVDSVQFSDLLNTAKKLIVKPAPAFNNVPNLEPLKKVQQPKVKVPLDSKPATIKTSQTQIQQTKSNEVIKDSVKSVTKDVLEEKVNHEEKQETQTSQMSAQTLPPISQASPKLSQENLPLRRGFVPPIKLPSPTTETTQMKPKPYVRKFKTPLMIAEEKYRKQREEEEKMKGKSSSSVLTNTVREEAESTVQLDPERTTLTDLSHKRQDDFVTNSMLSATDQADQAFHSGQENSLKTTSAATMAVSSAAEQLENILKTCSENQHTKEEILYTFKELTQNVESDQPKCAQKPFSKTGKEKSSTLQQSELSKTIASSPKIKVKTIKVPTVDQTSEERRKDVLQQKGSNIKEKIIVKQSTQQSHKEQKSTFISEKHSNVTYAPVSAKQQPIGESTNIKKDNLPGNKQILTDKMKNMGSRGQKFVKPKQFFDKERFKKPHKVEDDTISKENAYGEKTVDHKEIKQIASGKQEQRKGEVVQQVLKGDVFETHLEQMHVLEHKQMLVTGKEAENKLSLQQHYGKELKGKAFETKDSKQEIRGNQHKIQSQKQTDKGNLKYSLDIVDSLRKREELQQILSRVREFEAESEKMDMMAMKVFLNNVPVWLAEKEEIEKLGEDGSQKMKEKVLHIKDQASAKLAYFEDAIRTALMSAATFKSEKESSGHTGSQQKICKISIGSSKLDMHRKSEIVEEKTVQHESKKEELSEIKITEQRASSPILKLRSPSPSYITIESTARRTESPQRVVPSPPLPVQRDATPPPPPPRRSETPTSKIQRPSTSPSPPRSRAEKLAKLKDTTAKLSQGTAQHQQTTPVQVTEKKSEIIQSPATLRRQLKIETQVVEVASTANLPEPDSTVTAGMVKDMKQMFEEAGRAETSKVYMRKDPIDIPERLGPDTDDLSLFPTKQAIELPKVDLSGLVHKFETPDHKVYVRKEPILIAERLRSDSEEELDKKQATFEIPAFDVKSVKTVFEGSERAGCKKQKKQKFSKAESEVVSFESESLAESSKGNYSGRMHKGIKGDISCEEKSQQLAHKQQGSREKSPQPKSYSETKCVADHFAGVDKHGNKTIGLRTATSVSQGSESIKFTYDSKHAPPTYEDVISGHILDISADDSPEELLKNFQKTWQESERVFKSLGYKLSETEATGMQSNSHSVETSHTEDTDHGKRDMRSLSKDSLSNGKHSRRQTNLS
ncbi:xin actin-binding repeat-containing protein 2 [Latimeria chalumnae]|uniref:xin actin-binding repeat-containing protein 2 n=1 Tax=Latimeria chalumnae TaxID=7897 RepID=UPI00313E952B